MGSGLPRARSGVFWTVTARRSKKTAHASEQQRPDVLRRRRAWFELQPDLEPERLVFIDETGASTKMARLAAGHRVANVAAPPYLTDIGRPPPSSAPSGWRA